MFCGFILQTLKLKVARLPDRLGKLWFVEAAAEKELRQGRGQELELEPGQPQGEPQGQQQEQGRQQQQGQAAAGHQTHHMAHQREVSMFVQAEEGMEVDVHPFPEQQQNGQARPQVAGGGFEGSGVREATGQMMQQQEQPQPVQRPGIGSKDREAHAADCIAPGRQQGQGQQQQQQGQQGKGHQRQRGQQQGQGHQRQRGQQQGQRRQQEYQQQGQENQRLKRQQQEQGQQQQQDEARSDSPCTAKSASDAATDAFVACVSGSEGPAKRAPIKSRPPSWQRRKAAQARAAAEAVAVAIAVAAAAAATAAPVLGVTAQEVVLGAMADGVDGCDPEVLEQLATQVRQQATGRELQLK